MEQQNLVGKDFCKCYDNRECFAKKQNSFGPGTVCTILMKTDYPQGKCPFCKPDREVTDGVRYPYNKSYAYRYFKGTPAK